MYNISIIIPVYNAEQTINRCLDSVLAQDIAYKEIICIDDGSTDSSEKIIRSYQKTNTDIVLLHQENKGAGVARNNGLAHATGRFVAFMDADDKYIDSSGLRRMVEKSIEQGCSVCAGKVFNEINGSVIKWDECAYPDVDLEYGDSKTVKYIDYQYDYAYQGYVFERKLLTNHGIEFPFYRRYQDPPFLVRALFYAQKFLFMNIDLYCYTSFTRYVKRSDVQVNDMLLGLKNNLEFSIDKKLKKLYKRTVERCDNEFYGVVKTSITEGNIEAAGRIIEIQTLINKTSVFGNDVLELFSWIESCLTNKTWISNLTKYKFPYDKIQCGSRIILYGAGHVGKEIKQLLDYTEYCTISAWVDQRFNEDVLRDYGVISPEAVSTIEADCILVAVDSEWLFESIKMDLKKILKERQVLIVGPIHSIKGNCSSKL